MTFKCQETCVNTAQRTSALARCSGNGRSTSLESSHVTRYIQKPPPSEHGERIAQHYMSLFLCTVGLQVWFQLDGPGVLQSKHRREDESLFPVWSWPPFHEARAKWQHLSVCLRDQHPGGTTWFCAGEQRGQSGWTIAQSEREWWRGGRWREAGFCCGGGLSEGHNKSACRGRSETGQAHNPTEHKHLRCSLYSKSSHFETSQQ